MRLKRGRWLGGDEDGAELRTLSSIDAGACCESSEPFCGRFPERTESREGRLDMLEVFPDGGKFSLSFVVARLGLDPIIIGEDWLLVRELGLLC